MTLSLGAGIAIASIMGFTYAVARWKNDADWVWFAFLLVFLIIV